MILRVGITVLIGSWGLNQDKVWQKSLLIPVWDAMATVIWLTSFTRKTIKWRGQDYSIQRGTACPCCEAGGRYLANEDLSIT